MDLKSRTINLTDAIADIRQFQTFCEKALTSHDKCNADAPRILTYDPPMHPLSTEYRQMMPTIACARFRQAITQGE